MSVLSYLEDLAKSLNVAENEKAKIETSVNALRDRLEAFFGNEVLEQVRFGSSTRATMLPRSADPESDVDYLIVFASDTTYKPETYFAKLRRFAEKYYHQSEIYRSTPTVVLSLQHIGFDLVPAVRRHGFPRPAYYIPTRASRYQEWMETQPLNLNDELAAANRNCNCLLKPAIRLLKYWNAKNGHVYESFSLENALARTSCWFAANLKDVLYRSLDGLPVWELAAYRRDRVNLLKERLGRVRALEALGFMREAQSEVMMVFPPLG